MEVSSKSFRPDREELSRLARSGYGEEGLGVVVVAHGSLLPAAQYFRRDAARLFLEDSPSLWAKVTQAIDSYDPERDFVLLEMGAAEETPIVSILPLTLPE